MTFGALVQSADCEAVHSAVHGGQRPRMDVELGLKRLARPATTRGMSVRFQEVVTAILVTSMCCQL